MFLRCGFLIVVVALFFGAARAEYEEPADDDDLSPRVARSLQGSLPRPGPRPHPSPTFPRLPRTSHPRYPREVDLDPEVDSDRYPRSLQPYKPRLPRFPSPLPLPGTVPQPLPARHRFKRAGGKVSVDVDQSRGSRTSTRVSVEQNLYKSNDGRTRVDASGYATDRGDRGGMINFSHRFP